MTAPDEPVGEATQAQIAAIVGNAQRLGLTWTLRQATITDVNPTVLGIYDGDTGGIAGQGGTPIAMTSMIGSLLLGQRVYVIGVPPSGNFVVGSVIVPYYKTILLGMSASSVTFTGIPPTLRKLRLDWTARGDTAATTTLVGLRINSVATASYSYQTLTRSPARPSRPHPARRPSSGPASPPRPPRRRASTAVAAATSSAGIAPLRLPGHDRLGSGAGHVGLSLRGQRRGLHRLRAIPEPEVLASPGNFITGSYFQLRGE